MKWYVFYHSINERCIKRMNIFDHTSFNNNVVKKYKLATNKEEFAKELESELMYYFWCKSEYEVVIKPWCGDTGNIEMKVDIYMQVKNNWEVFLDYVWDSLESEK